MRAPGPVLWPFSLLLEELGAGAHGLFWTARGTGHGQTVFVIRIPLASILGRISVAVFVSAAPSPSGAIELRQKPSLSSVKTFSFLVTRIPSFVICHPCSFFSRSHRRLAKRRLCSISIHPTPPSQASFSEAHGPLIQHDPTATVTVTHNRAEPEPPASCFSAHVRRYNIETIDFPPRQHLSPSPGIDLTRPQRKQDRPRRDPSQCGEPL